MPPKSRNLIFTSAGDNSVVLENWLAPNGNYDIMVCYYGESAETFAKFSQSVEYCFQRKGAKYQNLKFLFEKYPEIFEAYDYFFLLDDDIIFDGVSGINKLFELIKRLNLWVVAPTFKRDGSSKISHPITKQRPQFHYRYTNFFETGVPLVSKEVLMKFLKVYDEPILGWGVDYMITWSMDPQATNKYVLVDEVAVINPFDEAKANGREMAKLPISSLTQEQEDWEAFKKEKGIAELAHRNYKLIPKRKFFLKELLKRWRRIVTGQKQVPRIGLGAWSTLLTCLKNLTIEPLEHG